MLARTPDPLMRLRVLPGGVRGQEPVATDEEIVEGIQGGDRAAAGQLYDRLFRVVDGTLYRIVGRRGDDHDDLVQSVFEQILLSVLRRTFARRCSLTSWAACIANNVGLNALRSWRRQRCVFDRSSDPSLAQEWHADATAAERLLVARSDLDRLRACLAAMDPRRAAAVVLHDALGHDLDEVARLSGVSIAAAQSRLVRGRRELAQRMAADERSSDRGTEEA
ncbi:MAG: RNA polymerase sigma factor [Deltaproteobacteria bacterium]|nr:RNA polymerase sigma factor [Deltaproteobacteria bacterium]